MKIIYISFLTAQQTTYYKIINGCYKIGLKFDCMVKIAQKMAIHLTKKYIIVIFLIA